MPAQFAVVGFNGVRLQRPQHAGGEWQLISPLTMEKVPLPAPTERYILEWLDDDCAACDTGSDLFVEAESVFTKLLVRELETGALKFACWQERFRRWRLLDYLSMRTDYRNLEVTLFVGPTRAKQSMNGAMLRLPRDGGAKIFWEVVTLYDILQLSCHQKVRRVVFP